MPASLPAICRWPPSVDLDMPDGDCFVFAEHDGLIEPLVDLGARVLNGEAVARIWAADRTAVEPVVYGARRDGILAARHFPGFIKAGDRLAVVAAVVA